MDKEEVQVLQGIPDKVISNVTMTTTTTMTSSGSSNISRDKVQAKISKSKSKTLKSRSHKKKNTIAGKVWERLGAVRKTRSAGDIAAVDRDDDVDTEIVICFDKLPAPPAPPPVFDLPPSPPPEEQTFTPEVPDSPDLVQTERKSVDPGSLTTYYKTPLFKQPDRL